MRNIFKIVLWLVVVLIIAYLAFGGSKKQAVAPTPEMTGGAGGERAQIGENVDSSLEINSSLNQ